MKIVAILYICLTITSFAADLRRPISSQQVESLNNIIKDKKWASIILKLAELHMMAKGPVDTLVNAIEGVVSDLTVKLDRANTEFARVTSDHEAEVRRMNDLIREAELDINNSQELLNNVLLPQKQQLEESIASLENRLTDLQDHVEEAKSLRESSRASFQQRQTEHTEAIAACSEALEILQQLINGDASLIQISSAKESLEKVKRQLKGKTLEDPFVKALLNLSTAEFSDSAAVNRVVELLNQVRSMLSESLNGEQTTEENNQADYEADMVQTRKDQAEAQSQLSEAQTQHSQNEESIASNNDFISKRTADQLGFQNDLDLENDAFQADTNSYNALVGQFNKELDACKRALEVLNSNEISDYIGSRMEQDRVIDTQHGSGIRANVDDFHF